MNRYGLKAFIILGFLSALVGVDAQTPGYQQPTKTHEVTDLCDILESPEKYVNKEVIVEAEYRSGFEMGWLEYPDACDKDEYERSAIRTLFHSGFESNSKERVVKRFRRLARHRNGGDVHVPRVAGIFLIKIQEFAKSNPNDIRFEYDFVIMKIISLVDE